MEWLVKVKDFVAAERKGLGIGILLGRFAWDLVVIGLTWVVNTGQGLLG